MHAMNVPLVGDTVQYVPGKGEQDAGRPCAAIVTGASASGFLSEVYLSLFVISPAGAPAIRHHVQGPEAWARKGSPEAESHWRSRE